MVTGTQKFIVAVLGVLVPALVTLGTVYINSQQTRKAETVALANYDAVQRVKASPAPEPPQPRRASHGRLRPESPAFAGSRTDMVRLDSIVRVETDTTPITVQPSAIGKFFGAEPRTIQARKLRAITERK